MIRKYFKHGSPVTAESFTGQKIIGIYQGPANGLGVWVYGFEWGKDPILDKHRCISLTLKTRVESTPEIKSSEISFLTGEWCKGETSKGETIIGKFMQTSGPKFAYIKNHADQQAYKVLRATLTKKP